MNKMATVLSPDLSKTTLNINRLKFSIERRHRMAGWQNKIQQYVAYKRLTAALVTYIDWEWRDGKKLLHANCNQ